jgi:hypothetical protein
MLIDPALIPVYALIIGNVLAVAAGLWWVKTSYTYARLLKQPKPKISKSVAKVLTCVLSFWLLYVLATYKWF